MAGVPHLMKDTALGDALKDTEHFLAAAQHRERSAVMSQGSVILINCPAPDVPGCSSLLKLAGHVHCPVTHSDLSLVKLVAFEHPGRKRSDGEAAMRGSLAEAGLKELGLC